MYIRTKDGVYEVKVNKYHELVYCKDNQIVLSCNILNQSENIEELCDVYVVPRFQHIFKIDKFSKNAVENYVKGKDKGIVYGAIWTSKGLIYVAKMNNEGKLVLI